jgi:hypothetical protein
MRNVKSLFVIALALAFTAILASAGAASATIMCEVGAASEACPEKSVLPVPSSIGGKLKEGTEATFKGTIEIKCKESTMEGQTTKEETGSAEAPLLGEITAMKFGGCTGCTTVEALNLPYKASLVPAAKEGNGTLTLESSGKGQPSFKASKCALGLSCTFGAKSVAYNFEGGKAPAMKTETVLSREVGTEFCGKTGTMIQDFQRMPVGPPIVVMPASVLCEVNTRPCPAGKVYLINSMLEVLLSSGKAKFIAGGLTVECNTSSLIGKTTANAGVPGVITPSFTACANNCEVEVRNLTGGSYVISISAVGTAGNGEMGSSA